jgi:hypothetical protein
VIGRSADLLARRANLISLFFTGLGVVAAAFYWYQLTSQGGAPVDVHAYWVADPNNLYPPADSALHQDAYLYSPAFELLVGWGRHLSFEAFTAIWRAVLLLTLVWLAGPFTVLVLFTVPVASEVNAGNIQILLAAAIVVGFGRPAGWTATWAFVLLTKVTPGVGLLWFAARREWRRLAVAVGVTALVAGATFLVWPDRWLDWTQLIAGGGTPEPLAPYYLPFWPRFVGAAVIVLIGAWRGWRWPVVVAGCLALPGFYTISPSMLVGVLPFLREAMGRWTAKRADSRGRGGA